MAPINFGGDDVTGVTIGGDAVQEITVDGDVVWTATEPGPDEVMLDDVESYSSTDDFHDTWGVPEAYVDITTSNAIEGSQSIISGESYADGTKLDSSTSDGNIYSAVMVHGTTDDGPALLVNQQTDRDIQDCIRCEIDARDNHVEQWVWENGSIVNETRVDLAVPTDYVYKWEMEVTSDAVNTTIYQSDNNFSSSWSYANETFSDFTTISTGNNASYTSGMIGFYGGRGSGSKWDRFTETPIA